MMDDEDNLIATVVKGHTFTVDSRYVMSDSRILGQGSFGVVCTAYDAVRRIDVAIKRTRPYAEDDWHARHTLREVRLLKLLSPHPNIITMYELSLNASKKEIYMMLEVMDCDLHRVIQSKQPLTEKHYKCFMKQILEGVKAMHSIGVFHRDLKPGNILVTKDCQLRITDFGLARFVDEPTRLGKNEANPMTAYVVTRWYRCPELFLAPNTPYNEGVDMWSVGCILGELIRRNPLFPGKNDTTQLKYIFDTMGYAGPESMGFPMSQDMEEFFDKHYRNRKKPLYTLVPDASEGGYDLLEALLTVNPKYRPSAQEALQSRFFDNVEVLFDYSQEVLTRPDPAYFEFENEEYSVQQLKNLIDMEVYESSAGAYRYPQRELRQSQKTPSRRGDTSAASQEEKYTDRGDEEEDNESEKRHSFPGAAPAFPEQMGHKHKLQSKSYDSSSDSDGNSNKNNGPESQQPTQDRYAKQHNAIKRYSVDGTNTLNRIEVEQTHANTKEVIEETRRQLAQVLLRDNSAEVNNTHEHQNDDHQHHMPAATNILASIRNEVGPPGTRGKRATPKTPTPSKMDLIIKKDHANKQRFQEAQSTGGNSERDDSSARRQPGETTQPNTSDEQIILTARTFRSTFPDASLAKPEEHKVTAVKNRGRRLSSDGFNPFSAKPASTVLGSVSMDTGDLHNAGSEKSSKRFGSFIGVPFPSLTKVPHSVSKAVNKRINNLFHGGGGSNGSSHDEGDVAISSTHSSSVSMTKSSTIMHSGSNVILPNSQM